MTVLATRRAQTRRQKREVSLQNILINIIILDVKRTQHNCVRFTSKIMIFIEINYKGAVHFSRRVWAGPVVSTVMPERLLR